MLADGTVEKPIKCMSTTFFLTTISILSGSSYDADICEGAITFMASLISHLMLDASPSESFSQWSVPGVCFYAGKPWVSAFTWKSSATHHQAEHCCRWSIGPPLAKVIPAGSDPHSRTIQKVLPHCRNCSGVAQRSWQVAQGVDLASRFPKP